MNNLFVVIKSIELAAGGARKLPSASASAIGSISDWRAANAPCGPFPGLT
jgi:hypothetical protein